ncbi:hypothetical protein LTR10_023068 [Elasticomyces elasticus]|uniref:Ketoreductase domain-containing protein n=1 Tax=Exophiala sideris TaxID=1016849 RepID=A0ABR0IUQ3_9EURO|nr:hypothetical protein LTR10_023068 [Elasticomyces elasticus]KAK5021087.1 hypothetical protein LTS07_011240 [Exophiala sideris]KAK5023285.1 hypothetical protein LTR13_011275 [Exophiala sideris]KAK5048806.1 hypothetical protein LTR69_011269 [Exophiala sideris]KAK5176257.1 hypothetical protein LTR44_011188 [Eurotiomycetes sp. CCFEE 6388]
MALSDANHAVFANKTIAIIGAASGLGLAAARLLAQRGVANLSLADLNEQSLKDAAETTSRQSPNCNILTTAVDVRKIQDVHAWMQRTKSQFGALHGALNSAGVLRYATLADTTPEEWELVISVNLTGIFNCLKAELELLEDGGSIVNLASLAGLRGNAATSAYTASKHGVVGITRSVAQELGDRGIRVNALCPGIIETPMTADFANNRKFSVFTRKGTAEEVAYLISYLLSDESKFVTGAAVSIDGGFM